MRSTHTYVVMQLSPAVWAEIKAKMVEAGYQHAIDGDTIDMHGIAVEPGPERKCEIFDMESASIPAATINFTPRIFAPHVWPPDPSKPRVPGALADEVL